MNKEELSEIVSHANATWGRDPNIDAFKDQCRTWWRFLHDLDYEKVMAVIDRAAVIGVQFQPRPGDIRRKVMVGAVPDPMEAWEELTSAIHATNNGNEPQDLHELTLLTARRMGSQVSGLRTNGDRDRFISLYETTTSEWLADKCLTTPPPSK